MFKYLPRPWRNEFQNVRIKRMRGGMSGAPVYRVGDDRFLKIGRDGIAERVRQEIARTRWLFEAGVRVPEILRVHDDGETVAMLVRAVPGVGAAQSRLPRDLLIDAVGRALAHLHAHPVADCPYDETMSVRLERARRAIEAGEIDGAHFASRNRGIAPAVLHGSLAAAATPVEDLVVVHGDATLANMIVDERGIVGFIDCGHCGRADRYLDLAVTAGDIADTFGSDWIKPFADAYGEQIWQGDKVRFYSDLYELF